MASKSACIQIAYGQSDGIPVLIGVKSGLISCSMASAGRDDQVGGRCPTRHMVRTASEFAKQGKLGIGTYGEVHRAIDKRSGSSVALKRVRTEGTKEKRAGFPVSAIREIRCVIIVYLLLHMDCFFCCSAMRCTPADAEVCRSAARVLNLLRHPNVVHLREVVRGNGVSLETAVVQLCNKLYPAEWH